MFNLYHPFSVVKNEKDFFNFLYDLCTPKEIRELSERWNIAQLLSNGKMTQRAIADKLNCSTQTVTRVARFMNDENFNGYKRTLNKLGLI